MKRGSIASRHAKPREHPSPETARMAVGRRRTINKTADGATPQRQATTNASCVCSTTLSRFQRSAARNRPHARKRSGMAVLGPKEAGPACPRPRHVSANQKTANRHAGKAAPNRTGPRRQDERSQDKSPCPATNSTATGETGPASSSRPKPQMVGLLPPNQTSHKP
jgi:hypothetical protein